MKKSLPVLLISVINIFCHKPVQAQVPGTPDSSFAVNGIQLLQPSSGFDNAYSIAMLDDGKMLIGGASEVSGPGNWDVVVYRLNPDGSIDETFGNNGFAYNDYQNYSQYVRSMKRLSNGKLLFVGGAEVNFQVDVFATQLNEDGTPDTDFGDNGTVLIPIGTGEDICMAAVEQADGKIVIVGNYGVASTTFTNPVAIRLNTDGSLDDDYGTNGIALIDAGYNYESAEDVILMDDGGIMATGYAGNSHYDILSFRLDGSGQLNPNYGINGIAVYNLNNGDDMAYAITKSPVDGKILIGGKVGSGSTKTDFLVMAVNEYGLIDSSFGTNGKTSQNIKVNDAGLDLAVQSNGRIILGGTAGAGFATNDFAICRFNQDGSIDSTFGTNGSTLSEISSFFSDIEDVALQPDGKIVACGIAASANNDMGIVRYKGDDVATGAAALNTQSSAIQCDLYPNPSNGSFNLSLYDASGYSGSMQVQLLKLTGQLVFEKSIDMNSGVAYTTLDITKMTGTNTYILKVTAGNCQFNRSVVIQH
ncbi:MAG: T9SS type A sorting domain-containing protein [Chitinophagales bacterium]|nr:T9SS type A sorting domain-containing protein [Chitinophagales bacterium]